MKWLKLFEEYSDTTKIEKANIFFLTYQIMKELNAMELEKVENNHYTYFYTGAKGEEKVKFVLNKIVKMFLVPNTIAKKISAKFSSHYYVDPFIEKTFLKCVHDFFFYNKYITGNFSTLVVAEHANNLGGHQTNLKKLLKEQS